MISRVVMFYQWLLLYKFNVSSFCSGRALDGNQYPQVPNIYCCCYILSSGVHIEHIFFLSTHVAIFDICGKYEKIRRKIMLAFSTEKYGFLKIHFMFEYVFHLNYYWKSHLLSLHKMHPHSKKHPWRIVTLKLQAKSNTFLWMFFYAF